MTSLEQIVLPLKESQALEAAGIHLDTALVWVGLWGINAHWHVEGREQIEMLRADPQADRIGNGATLEERGLITVGAPVLSELIDAIRTKLGTPLDERTIILTEHGAREVTYCAESRDMYGNCNVAYHESDLLAAYELLREVSK